MSSYVNKKIQPNIVMLKHDLNGVVSFPFPSGFHARAMHKGDDSIWMDIWRRELEPSIKVGDDLFQNQFGVDWNVISQRCFLIFDESGNSVGTISAWYDDSFKGERWGRIHWVALRKAYQGKGLAKPMLSMALSVLAEHHAKCCLTTQVYRIPAIKLYLGFGFVPDISNVEALEAWTEVAKSINHPALYHLKAQS